METVVHKDGFLLARMKAVPSGQTSVNQGQKLIRNQWEMCRLSDYNLVTATDRAPTRGLHIRKIAINGVADVSQTMCVVAAWSTFANLSAKASRMACCLMGHALPHSAISTSVRPQPVQ
jgi:hypothetical protein